MLLLNALSGNMFNADMSVIRLTRIDTLRAIELLHGVALESAIGHKAAAKILSQALGQEVRKNRVTVKMGTGSSAILAQYVGPRLEENATELPSGARIDFFLLEVC